MTSGNETKGAQVRDDFVPKDAYISREFLEQEKRNMWSRVWQVACREEELKAVGDYVTYDIHDESFIVVRTAEDKIEAFHNVCMHRGRRLTAGCGHARKFHCNYHGWRWNLDGSVNRILDRTDWQGCPNVSDDDFKLRDVKVGTWGGFVYINPDPDAEPLADYLAPMPDFIDPFEFEKMRYRWYVTVKLPCNWKVALEAFNEGYHVAATHPQLLDNMGDDVTRSYTYGKHGMFGYPTASRPWGAPSPRTGKPMPEDLRPGIIRFFDVMNTTLRAIYTERDTEAARRLMSETQPSDDIGTLIGPMIEFQKQAAEASGAGWPEVSLEQVGQAGVNWHVFPNQVFLMYFDGALCYRARPHGDDPDSCLYDIWSLVRYAPGAEPPLERQEFLGDEDWKGFSAVSIILQQDFDNMEQVQKGMKSTAFEGSRTSPLQESSVSNLHRWVRHYALGDDLGATRREGSDAGSSDTRMVEQA
ncbi:aromatic ring-hydroxylating oxygenase subunit alpha [Novosphingobium malaysiense]|uniref:aromatic ring-hydroxylating oxygenase subunit alpha n=1 Tax=Novosphingobium malaysiense TaxID=1348853 RepID=UPI0009DFE008|nr:aromatic ring-hydroxylating dioxygenase subunit alpha [Novosphingobium malaysiense]